MSEVISVQPAPICRSCGSSGIPGSLVCQRCGTPYYPGHPQQQPSQQQTYQPYGQQGHHQQLPPGHQQNPYQHPPSGYGQSPSNYPHPQPPRGAFYVPPGSHSVLLAVILNLCCVTEVGQIYNKQLVKGLVIIVTELTLGYFFAPLVLPIWIIGVVDSALIANRLNRGEWVGEWQWF